MIGSMGWVAKMFGAAIIGIAMVFAWTSFRGASVPPAASASASPAEIRQRQILKASAGKPADPELSPENAALERWLDREITAGRKPQLALELHNDGNGLLHISRPPVPQLEQHLSRMKTLEALLRRHTWFTEGTTSPSFRNAGTLGDGWVQRYGIDAAVHEFNCNWIEGLKQPTSSTHWREYGAGLARVFYDYFETVKP